MAMQSAGRMAENAPAHLPVYGGGVARPAKVAKPAFDDFLRDFGKRQAAQDFIDDVNRDFTATWRHGYGYGDEFDNLGHFEELRAGEDLARSAREASAAYDARVASELARVRASNAGRAGGWAWDPTGLLVPSLAAKSLSASAPATAQGPDAAPLTTTIGIEDDAELLADVVKVSPHVDAAPKVSTTGEPSINLFEEATKEFTDRLETTTAPETTTKTKTAPLPDEVRPAPETTTRPAPLDEVAAPGAEPALQPLVFFSPAPSTVKAPKGTGTAAAEAQPVVFISSDPTPKTPHDRRRAEGLHHGRAVCRSLRGSGAGVCRSLDARGETGHAARVHGRP